MKKLDAKNRFSLLFIVATFGVALYAALHKDQTIIHWGHFGGHETSGMGYLILLLPLLTVALYLLLRKASNHPFTSMVQFDMPKTEHNARLLSQYFSTLSLCTTALLLYITICSVGFAPMIPLVVVLFVAFFGFYYMRVRRKIRHE